MTNKFSVILGNLGNICDRFCGGYKDNPTTEKMLVYKLKYYWTFIVVFLVGCSSKNESESAEQPNIIFLLADDLRDDSFHAMGHPHIKTPNIDKLINQGVRFDNTYIAEPICAPSRVSIFTGMYERLHGVGFSSSYQLTEEQWEKSYPAIMKRNSYYTGFIGKFGVEYYAFRDQVHEKFDFWYAHNNLAKFFPKEHNTIGCIPYHGADNDIITPIMGEAINNFLKSVPEKTPFCLSVSFNVPHHHAATSMYTDYENWHAMTRQANENPKIKGHQVYGNLYRNTDIMIPPETATDPYNYIPKSVLDQDKGRNGVYEFSYTRETCREHYIRYYQLITGLDKVIGDLMENLEDIDIANNTIIIFASDHGLLMGEYGMGGKALLYDLTSKIPFFIYDPRLPENQKGKTVNKLVSSLDIPVTILEYAGLEVPKEMQGRSLLPLINGEEVQWRNELFLESLFTLRDNPFCEGIRTKNWKYIRMYDGVKYYQERDLNFEDNEPDFEQLFNLKDDPQEMNNLVDQYKDSSLLIELREKVKKYSQELNNKREKYLKTHRCAKWEGSKVPFPKD